MAKKKSAASKKKRSGAARQPAKKKAAKKTSHRDKPVKKKAATKKKTATARKTTVASKALPPFPVVGLGASAGGLEALEEFIEAMPPDSGMAFVVVVHQAAKQISLLPELLDKCTPMDVVAIYNGITVQPNRVYIVPPGKIVDLLNNKLYLSDIAPRHAPPLPIDHFFRSLANAMREQAVAIVLSGTGTDGTVGLSAIKGESGMAMVQSVESAKFSGMPQNAIDSGLADYVLPPKKMPATLVAYARGPFLSTPRTVDTPSPSIQASLPEILLLLRRRCGHDFSGYKPSTVCRRIERRMNVHQLTEPKQYLRYLDQHEPEAQVLFKDLLISVTSFFRDSWAFDSLARQAILPGLQEQVDDTTYRVWVPGCATGEEAYSIAILLRECMDKLNVHRTVQIFATDLDADAVETARGSLFPGGIAGDVSAQRLAKFFNKQNGSYLVRKELRDWIVFAPQNIIHDPPFTKLDLLCCRNLLIYLQAELQKKLLTLFHYSLRDSGCLFLGTSETIGEYGDLFQTLDGKAKVFRRKDAPLRANRSAEFPITASRRDSGGGKKSDRPAEAPSAPIAEAVTQLLASHFVPPTVIVDDNGEIIHIHGRTGRFLELASGGPTKNILTMAREGLELDLASALRQAARQGEPVVRDNVPVKTNGDTELVKLIVQRIAEPKTIAGLLRVSFQVITAVAQPIPEQKSPAKSKKRGTNREKELQRELQHTRESLQRTIEELDASNEEMTSTNEELQSTNEELQSTNEELETSKEELQSLNEELQTVNAEFQEKINALSQANDDMTNLLNSTDIATIFLDNALCIKRYTEQAKRVIHLIPTDLGRPLRDLTSQLRLQNLVADAEAVLKTLVFKELEVQTEAGNWLLMRILPYRTVDDRINGLVMTFIDIDDLKRIQRENQQARDYAESTVDAIREPLIVLDDQLCVHAANRAFYSTFQVNPEETIGQLIYDLGNGQWDIPGLRELLETILPKDGSFDDFEVEHEFPTIGLKHLLLNARRITGPDGEADLILLAFEERTR